MKNVSMLMKNKIAGCENGCSRHGICTLQDGEYSCECSPGWAGRDCSIGLEMECEDEIDNDHGTFYTISFDFFQSSAQTIITQKQLFSRLKNFKFDNLSLSIITETECEHKRMKEKSILSQKIITVFGSKNFFSFIRLC